MDPACPDAVRLALMLDDHLDGTEAGAVEAHVATCPACQKVLERLSDCPIRGTSGGWAS